jgi:diguanylate cyclase (GGDEF)-like protein
MRLATITNWAYGATVLLTLTSGTTMLLASAASDLERAAVTQRYELDQATSSADEDVAMLSGLARQFAISGGDADLAAYRREAGLLRTVEERTGHIRDAGATTAELQSLHDAMHWADALRDEQQAAIAVRQSGNRDSAVAILFSPEYDRELDRIQSSVERFQDRIDQRTEAMVRTAAGRSHLWRSVSEIVLSATGLLFLCVLFFVFRQRVLRPVVRLSDVITRLAAQDYRAEPPTNQHIDEIGDMAQALCVFRENGIERQRLEIERDADRAMRDLLYRMTQRMQGCDSTEDLKSVVQRFVPEVAPQLAGRLYLLDPVRGTMVEACAWLGATHSRTEFAPIACWALRRGSPHHTGAGCIDVPCEHIGSECADLPDSLCLPLAARHGMLGLLYFERHRDSAREVPDMYLRMLAENVGLALDNLRLRDALRDLALVDPLTALPNRRQLDAMLDTCLVESERTQTPISCAMIDIDHFKRFNDEHGHEAGDTVLQAVGAALKLSVREDDRVFRYGGEEFLMLMPGLDATQAQARGETIRSRIGSLHLHYEGRELGPITASIGISSAPALCTRERLVQTADAALLRAKRNGRDRIVAAQPRRIERAEA